MITQDEKVFFLQNGYFVAEDALDVGQVRELQEAFDQAFAAVHNGKDDGRIRKVEQPTLLQYRPFIDLIEHPAILERQRAIFGNQVQLIAYDLLRQGPRSSAAERSWHRDFTFPGDRPLAINTILFIDDIRMETGPTRVVPGTHRGEALPPRDKRNQPLEGEVAVPVPAGSAIFINGAIWHTGGRNGSDGLRRGIYMYYGYWWLKRYNADRALPWQALEGASPLRLQLLGVKMPDHDLHMYDPTL